MAAITYIPGKVGDAITTLNYIPFLSQFPFFLILPYFNIISHFFPALSNNAYFCLRSVSQVPIMWWKVPSASLIAISTKRIAEF